jgi:hypothetical protein
VPSDSSAIVDRSQLLGGFAAHAEVEGGVSIPSLEAGSTIIVRTHHSEYSMVVLDSARCRLLVQGGEHIEEPTEVTLQGATAGRHLLKVGWIGTGLRMEMCVGDRRVLTSPVRAFVVEPPEPTVTF